MDNRWTADVPTEESVLLTCGFRFLLIMGVSKFFIQRSGCQNPVICWWCYHHQLKMQKGFEIAAKFQGERDTHPRGGRHGERDNKARQNDGGGKEKRSWGNLAQTLHVQGCEDPTPKSWRTWSGCCNHQQPWQLLLSGPFLNLFISWRTPEVMDTVMNNSSISFKSFSESPENWDLAISFSYYCHKNWAEHLL